MKSLASRRSRPALKSAKPSSFGSSRKAERYELWRTEIEKLSSMNFLDMESAIAELAYMVGCKLGMSSGTIALFAEQLSILAAIDENFERAILSCLSIHRSR